MDFELMMIGDVVQLYHEDTLFGKDVTFTFHRDGTVDITKGDVTTRIDTMIVQALEEALLAKQAEWQEDYQAYLDRNATDKDA